jgi:hypothetical protein
MGSLRFSKVRNLVFLTISISLALPNFAVAEEDPFPGIADGAEVSARQPINPRTGDPADGSAPITCPAGSGRSQVANATTREQYLVCVKNWRPTSTINADNDFRARQEAARAQAEAESKAWNAANPGKQKCVQWGPIVHANGVSTASGGVCANPVEPGPNTTVATQDAPSVSAPTDSTSSTSTSTSTSTATTTSTSASSSSTSSSSSNTTNATEYFPQWGSGTPYTRVLRGQLSTSECPSGFQGANGVIVAIGTGTFTECWPENAWAAYRLGGNIWEQFKSSGGTYDAKAEETRRNKVSELKALAKSVAQKAADETPGIQRCSTWTGYGETGQECAYTFVSPTGSSTSGSTTSGGSTSTSETSTATTSSTQSGSSSTTSANTSSSTNSPSDPFPLLKNGEEIPGTRVSSEPGVTQLVWEASSTYRSSTCPSGSGRASGVDLRGTLTSSDDIWFSYCVKSWAAVSTTKTETSTVTSSGGATSSSGVATPSSSTSDTSTVATRVETSTANSSSTAPSSSTETSTSNSSTSSSATGTPTLTTTSINVSGTSNQVKELISKVVDSEREQRAMVSLMNSLDRVLATLSSRTVRLPSSRTIEESATSETPDICRVEGLSVVALKRGTCVINYSIVDSDGNTFSTKKTFSFRR